MDLPKRKPNRLPDFDYSTPGAYFLTVCTEGRRNLLCNIVGGGAFDALKIQLTKTGEVVKTHILSGNRIPGITVDKYVIMPNHVHMILLIDMQVFDGTPRASSPTTAVIPHFISTWKRFCHRDLGQKIFQRSYHDHVIRGDADYLKIWQYIENNPFRWEEDCFYTE